MMRDKIGGFASREEIEKFLNNWIMNYAVANDDVAFSVKASHPLKEARVDVVEVAGKPGVYRAVAFLRPHFQLDELTMSMRLVADLPAPAK
jgi:type VI secretion system protein ImpC